MADPMSLRTPSAGRLGNALVPMQDEAALRALLARMEVIYTQ